jgi:hypothetical protein
VGSAHPTIALFLIRGELNGIIEYFAGSAHPTIALFLIRGELNGIIEYFAVTQIR